MQTARVRDPEQLLCLLSDPLPLSTSLCSVSHPTGLVRTDILRSGVYPRRVMDTGRHICLS